MAHTLTITLDDRTYAELEAMARIRGESLEGIASTAVQGLCDDPLDKHIGAYPTGAAGWADHHHDTIGQALMVAERSEVEDF